MPRPDSINNITPYSMSFYLFLALIFVLIGRPQDIFPFLKPYRPALTFIIITLIATLLTDKRFSLQGLLEVSECKKYTLFYLIMILGIPFAYHMREAFNYIFLLYMSNILFFYLFLVQVDSFKKLKSVIFTICLSIFIYSIFSLTKGSFSYGRFSFGTMYDPNDLAYLLVSFFPLCFFFIVNAEGFIKKMIAGVTIVISLAVILFTGSRGGFLGLIVVFILIYFTKLGGIKRSYKIALLTGLIIIFVSYGGKIDTERFMSLTKIGSGYNVTDEFGRFQIWKKAFKLTLYNPITGVGVNCFSMAIGYAREAEGIIPRWQVAHNSYVQVATEVGLIGFAIFISIIIGCLKNFSRFIKTNISYHELQEIKNISGLLLVGFIGQLTCAFFLTQAYSILFTLFFALSAVMKKLYPNLEGIKNRRTS